VGGEGSFGRLLPWSLKAEASAKRSTRGGEMEGFKDEKGEMIPFWNAER
jgi:hypothetical protein